MRIITGPAWSGKTTLVLREFKEALRGSRRNVRLIVPTATLVRHFQHELARDGCVFPPDLVTTLHRFLMDRAPECRLIPDALLRAILRGSVDETAVDTTVEAIQLFENAAMTPRIEGWRQIAAKIKAAGYQTRPELLRAAAKNKTPLTIWLDGFQDFSRAETEFLTELARVCTVTIVGQALLPAAASQAAQLSFEDEEIELTGNAPHPQIALTEARTPEQEAAEIARRIVDLHAAGVPLRRIAIAIRNTPLYLPLLAATFERFRIPARFFFPQPLATHPVAILLNGLIEGALANWDFAATVDCLRAHPGWGRSAEFDRFDFSVREAMPGRGSAAFLACCEGEWLREEIERCLEIEAWTRESLTPAKWADRFEDLAARTYRPGQLDVASDPTAVAAARSHIAALRSWIEAVQSIAGYWTDRDQPVSLEAFWRIAAPAVKEAVWQAPDRRAEAVEVMSVYEARQWNVDALFICGMVDGDYPQRKLQNPFVIAAGIAQPDSSAEERALFESLRTRASKSLLLSWPRHNPAGRSVERSRYLDEFGPAEIARSARPMETSEATSPPVAGRISSLDLLPRVAALHTTIGISRLEDLAQCRFKFFSGRTLGLQGRPERPGERLNARLGGLILHKTMERWLGNREQGFVEHFETAFEEICREENIPPGYRLEVDRVFYRGVAKKVSANEQWNPSDFHLEKELELQFARGIRVTGRVDRIDMFREFPDECVIVDYKSGKLAGVERFVESPAKLQGPLYALAVREQLKLNPAAVIFWAVRDDRLFGWGRVPGTDIVLKELPSDWAVNAKAAVEERLLGYLDGAVYAKPEDRDLCRWCDFAGACRVEAVPEERTLTAIRSAGASAHAG